MCVLFFSKKIGKKQRNSIKKEDKVREKAGETVKRHGDVPTTKYMVRFDLNELKVLDSIVECTTRNSGCKMKNKKRLKSKIIREKS